MFDLALKRKTRLLSAAERKFFRCLSDSLGDEYWVFPNVRASNVVEPALELGVWKARKIAKALESEYFDFLVCRAKDLSIYAVVELERFEDDVKIRSKDKEQPSIVEEICKSADLRLFLFDIRQDYQRFDLRRLITGRAQSEDESLSPTHQSQLTIEQSSISVYGRPRKCPNCGHEVVTKVSVKGDNIGEKWHGGLQSRSEQSPKSIDT